MEQAVYICTGESCRKKTGSLKKLYSALLRNADIEFHEVGCQKVCSGPVVGLRVKGKWEWFTKIRKPRHYSAILKTLRRGRVAKRLAERREKKRSGKCR